MTNNSDIKNLNFIGIETSLHGDLRFTGPTYFHGNLSGNIYQEDEEILVCEISSNIDGDIFGTNIEIYGVVTGQIHASNSLIVYPTATVNGQLKAKSFRVYAGAQFNGEMNSTQPVL